MQMTSYNFLLFLLVVTLQLRWALMEEQGDVDDYDSKDDDFVNYDNVDDDDEAEVENFDPSEENGDEADDCFPSTKIELSTKRNPTNVDGVLIEGNIVYFFEGSTVFLLDNKGITKKSICEVFPHGPRKVTAAAYHLQQRCFVLINSRKIYIFKQDNGDDEPKLIPGFPRISNETEEPIVGGFTYGIHSYFFSKDKKMGLFYNYLYLLSKFTPTSQFFRFLPPNLAGGYNIGEVRNNEHDMYYLFGDGKVGRWTRRFHENDMKYKTQQEFFDCILAHKDDC